ncbi:cation:proton antiporter [Desulfogranum marinum]|uniref:cation:proton antiporter n=1 Tax=Desulfogranum marinum TaxID=453220 RepID=UPI0019635ADB|nr:cation:proton antiporter [Desulfogranum marinum]MBM9515256.1 cation:proton antiporter [Desulfogranum marinum]
MEHHSGVFVLLFVIVSLFTGALLRHSLKNIAFPYTVALLVLGLSLGLAERSGVFPENFELLGHALQLVVRIDPHLIMFLFLPTLIFESAFAMEVHLFRRAFLQIAILATPGLLVSILLTAILAKLFFPWNWSWPAALLFGSLISATDPVAVVALLKELSSRKRLETLLEGESLMNDGTAIVFFALFYHLILDGTPQETSWGLFSFVGWQFLWGVSIGLLVGLAFGTLAMVLIGKVFKDAMVEITISVAVAYLAFLVAETIFHVSGVMAVVALALLLAGVGKTRISPEISEFLHHFWEMMAYIANTIIFLLVGLIIALRVKLDSPESWKALFILFAGILLIRAFSISLFLPILKHIGIGINFKKAVVLSWGGLRGAVALTLALTVAQDQRMPTELGEQILFLTAGIVVLTLLVNGTTMRLLLQWLDLSKLPPAKQTTVDRAKDRIEQEMAILLPRLKKDGFFQGADWNLIDQQISMEGTNRKGNVVEAQSATAAELDCEFRRRLLEAERKNYWLQFKQGLLGGAATHVLVDAVERALDQAPTITPRPLLHKLWEKPTLLRCLEKLPLVREIALSGSFDRLALGYDVARGFIHAQDANTALIDQLAPSPESGEAVRQDILKNKSDTYGRIEQLRQTFPEVIVALETRAACRSLLNRQRGVIDGLIDAGLLDTAEADKLLQNVDERLKQLRHSPTKIEVPGPGNLLEQAVWLNNVSPGTRNRLLSTIEVRIHSQGEILLQQGEPEGSMAVVVRGSVELLKQRTDREEIEDILGPGSVLGIYNSLTGKNDKTVRAHGPVEILWLNKSVLQDLLVQDSVLIKNLNCLYDEGRTIS